MTSKQVVPIISILSTSLGFPCGSAGKESACKAGGRSSVPGLGRSPGEGKGYPLQAGPALTEELLCVCVQVQRQVFSTHI